MPTRARGRVDEKPIVDNWNKGVSVQRRLGVNGTVVVETGEFPAEAARTNVDTSLNRKGLPVTSFHQTPMNHRYWVGVGECPTRCPGFKRVNDDDRS